MGTLSKEMAALTYTDSHGNAEIIRLMLAVCGESFTHQVALEPELAPHLNHAAQFDRMCAAGVLAFDQFPLLQIDGLNLVQKHAAVRYLARKHGLYGQTNAEATMIDILFDGLVDFGGNGAAVNQKAQDKYLPRIERALRAGSDGFLVGGALSMADVQLFYVIDYVYCGDVTPNPFFSDAETVYTGNTQVLEGYPLLAKHYTMMGALPSLMAYLGSELRLPRNGPEGWVDRVKTVLPHLVTGELYPMSCDTWSYHSDTTALSK